MKIKAWTFLAMLAGPSLVPPAGFAHHGSSAYDFTKLITSKATVTSLEWGNPHCILKFDIKDEKGAVTPGRWKCTIHCGWHVPDGLRTH
jgi:Family of unknown function (DUF6152)